MELPSPRWHVPTTSPRARSGDGEAVPGEGPAGLADAKGRSDKGKSRRLLPDAITLIEGLALQKPPRSMAATHRHVTAVALEQGCLSYRYREPEQDADDGFLCAVDIDSGQATRKDSVTSTMKGKEMPHSSLGKNALIIGASRGLGYALAQVYLNCGWHVVATVRGLNQTKLHALMDAADGRLEIETVDITVSDQITGLHERLASRRFDLLFVNAGVTNQPEGTVGEVSTEEFVRVMITNALSPMRVIETLQDLVPSTGIIVLCPRDKGGLPIMKQEATKYTEGARRR